MSRIAIGRRRAHSRSAAVITAAILAAPTAANAFPITGAPTVNVGAASGVTVVLPTPSSGARLHLAVWNLAASGGASLYCSDDGSTPSATAASFIVYAQGGYERDTPAWVPSAAIACVPASGLVPFKARTPNGQRLRHSIKVGRPRSGERSREHSNNSYYKVAAL